MSLKLPKHPQHSKGLTHQKGAGLPIALFIVTVLSLIVLGVSQVQESSGNATSLQIQSQRAFFAAESSAQVGVAKTLASEDCSIDGERISYTNRGLLNCHSDLSCSLEEVDIEGDSDPDEKVFTVTSVGQCGSGQDAASRTVEVRVR